MRRRLAQLLLPLAALSLVGVALLPLADRWGARHGARQQIGDAFEALLAGAIARGAQQERSCEFSAKPASSLLQMRLDDEPLASWASIGGCGAGGGSSATASGAKWIGRGVTGGLVDLQCLASQSVAKGDYYSTLNTRIGTSILQKWNFGLNIPLLYKVGTVEVLGTERSAKIAGFGDLSLEITRKLGITNASTFTLILTAPFGSSDAIRQGVVLPQYLQLGSGVLGATGQFEHTLDRDWGLYVLGASASYNGWTNGLGDSRAPSLTAYGHAGYFWGPFVPSAGLTLFGKFMHDRERYEPRSEEDDPLFLVVPNLSLEWSSDYLALLLSASTSLSIHGLESASFTLGVSASVF